MKDTDDSRIVELLQRPETRRAGFEQLVRQYSEQLYWQVRRFVLNHDDASDVLQNVFLKAWNRMDSFQGDSSVFTWITRIAINESLDYVRKQKLRAQNTDADLSLARQLQADPWFDGDEAQALLQRAVASLPDVQRTVFELRYHDEMKYSEMSKLLHASEGSLKASYHLAVKKIYKFFKSHD